MKNNYFEKLKDPRWQKKRLEIFERDEFSCRICESNENTLNVHHLIYLRNTDPWDYPDELLYTLCKDCHEIIRDVDFQGELIRYLLSNDFNIKCFRKIIKNPIDWVYTFAMNGFKSFSEQYREWLSFQEYLKKSKNG